MPTYLLDSNILIDMLRGRPSTVALLSGLTKEGELAMSALSVFEVKVGIRRGEEHATNTLLNGIASIAVDRSLASKAAEYARTYKTRGITLELVDSVLAATAVLNNFTLVTLNVLHFPMPEIRLLHVAR